LKLNYNVETCSSCFGVSAVGPQDRVVSHVVYDTRKIQSTEGALFFALEGAFRSGNDFVSIAYKEGIRAFVVPGSFDGKLPEDATVWKVENPLLALQNLALFHRNRFKGKVLAVTGSVGKTTFKEWLFHALQHKINIIRSPKSFNSQLGVALSLLELEDYAQLAIIEAGISEAGEMERLERIIRPDYGVLTALGSAHLENFKNEEELKAEKLKLFTNCDEVFISNTVSVSETSWIKCPSYNSARFPSGYSDLLGILKAVVHFLSPEVDFERAIEQLPTLALRMEVFEGINGNIVINDTYNLDKDALTEALHVQQNQDPDRKRIVVLGLAEENVGLENELKEIVAQFKVDQLYLVKPGDEIPWNEIENAVVLVKAHRKRHFEKEVVKGKARRHLTYIEVNLSALKHNLQVYKSRLPKNVKLLSMVKADAYGTGAVRVAKYLDQNGIDYLGVAFVDEGVELRQNGVQLPIVIMNPDVENADLYVHHKLEPAIYSFEQLDRFVSGLISLEVEQFPVHLKFDTGMHRLGFQPSEKEELLSVIKSQPEIRIQGIYSHLADADNPAVVSFTEFQLEQFREIVNFFRENTVDPIIAHVLNSEGALRFTHKAYDMVRIGISMYGYTENRELASLLKPAISWYSRVSQIKTVPAGDSVGYGRTFIAGHEMKIAIVPVGYADGFHRNLSNGNGSVFIAGKECKVVGRVCMDMIMVDITGLDVKYEDPVEIIGENQTMQALAKKMDTIPYEVLTGLSKRMQRIYINE
jgi:Alr-MurF fusion protein